MPIASEAMFCPVVGRVLLPRGLGRIKRGLRHRRGGAGDVGGAFTPLAQGNHDGMRAGSGWHRTRAFGTGCGCCRGWRCGAKDGQNLLHRPAGAEQMPGAIPRQHSVDVRRSDGYRHEGIPMPRCRFKLIKEPDVGVQARQAVPVLLQHGGGCRNDGSAHVVELGRSGHGTARVDHRGKFALQLRPNVGIGAGRHGSPRANLAAGLRLPHER